MMDKKNFCFKLYPVNKNIKKQWFVSYFDNGRVVKKYGKMNNYHTVEERMIEYQKIIDSINNPFDIQRRPTLIKQLQEILDNRKPRIELKSYRTYFSVLKKFTEWYHLNKDVLPGEFINYLFTLNYSNSTIRKSLIFLKSCFTELKKKNLYNQNPFEDIRVKKVKGKSKLPFHQNQVAELKAIITKEDPQLWDAIQFEYYLYFRPKEIRMLKVGDILFDEMKLVMRNEVAKDNDNYLKTIPLPMHETILKFKGYDPEFYIFSHCGRPGKRMLQRDGMSKRHKEFMKRLKYSTRFSFYSWVHTGIKMAAMAGIPMKQLQLQKGHSDLKMFDEYLKDLGVDDCSALKNNFPAI